MFSAALLVLAQVTGPISIHAPCTQTYGATVAAYSGNLAIVGWQLGFFSVNVVTGAQSDIKFKNGVWRAMLGGCTGRSDLEWNINDCWQSVFTMTASNGSPKWLLATDSPSGCGSATHPIPPGMNGLMVWKWNGSSFDPLALVQPPFGLKIRELGTPILDGDTGWVELTNNQGWVPCQLLASTCSWNSPQSSPPTGEGRQSGVGGFQYNVGIDYAHPNENGGPVWFLMWRSDQPTPTRPPAPTATLTPTSAGGVTRTPSKTPTYNPCPPFCPPTNTPTLTGTRPSGTPTPSKTVSVVSATPTATPTPSRFVTTVTWTRPDGSTGVGTAACVLSASGQFSDFSVGYYFFSSSNIELFLSVLPSYCSSHPNILVKAFGGSNVKIDIDVHDNQTGKDWTYTNPQGQMFQTQIVEALPCQ